MIGDRIRAARVSRGLSLRALAHEVGVSHQAIYKYERNEDVPSSDVLLALCDVLGVKAEYFFRPVRPLEIVPVFRKCARLSARSEKAILSSAKEWLERYLEVESLVPAVEPVDFPPQLAVDRVERLGDVEKLAEKLREAWGLGDGPIPKLMELLEDKGIRIGTIATQDEDFDACGFWIKGAEEVSFSRTGVQRDCGSAAIFIRSGVPGDRQRFSMAHELGHLLLQWLDEACPFSQDSDSGLSRVSKNLDIEAAANRFASAFLVPDKAAFRELGQQRHNVTIAELLLLKYKYGLSIQAWLRRAQELDIISSALQSRLFNELKSQGKTKVEPGAQIPPEEPGRMQRMVLRALAEGVITRSRAYELAGVTV